MITCITVAAAIVCSGLVERPSPAEALRILQQSVPQARIVVLEPRAPQSTISVPHDPHWPFKGPMVIPSRPQPWTRVTTWAPRFGPPITWIDGRRIR